MNYSNQFPKQEKEPLSIIERANFIWLNFEKNMPNLYKHIMKGKDYDTR